MIFFLSFSVYKICQYRLQKQDPTTDNKMAIFYFYFRMLAISLLVLFAGREKDKAKCLGFVSFDIERNGGMDL